MSGSNISITGSTVGIKSNNWYINTNGNSRFGIITGSNIIASTINIGGNLFGTSNSGFYNDSQPNGAGTANTKVGDYFGAGSYTVFTVTDLGDPGGPGSTNGGYFYFSGLNDSGVNTTVASINATNGAISFDSGSITSNGSGKLTTKGLTVTGSLNVTDSAVITGSLRVKGGIVDISGSTVGIKANSWNISTNGTISAPYIVIGDNSSGTGVSTSGTKTQIGDWQGGNNNTVFTIDDGNKIVRSNVGLTVTGSLLVSGSTTINNILTLTLQSTTPSTGFTTGSMIVSGSGTNVHAYFYNGTAWKQLDN
jgi:hypothetical protein